MSESLREIVEHVFAEQIAADDIELGSDAGELHIIGDEWTLVLSGDPLVSSMLAVDDEEGDLETVIEVIDEEALAALRDLDAALSGALDAALVASPDALTRGLARILEG
ncbi:MAG: hypothetical protein KC435_10280 [Thermomicrobiales bacterium]|nr:hypothetical protein [Thermomicrobiales bacterium]